MISSASVFRMSMLACLDQITRLIRHKTLPWLQEEHNHSPTDCQGDGLGKFMLAAELSGERTLEPRLRCSDAHRKNYAATLGEPIRREAAAGACFSVNHAATHQDRNEPTLRCETMEYSHSPPSYKCVAE